MKRFASLLAIGLFAVLPWSAGAQIAVIDASNLAQNIMTAARTLQTVTNQITQIQQTVQMLAEPGPQSEQPQCFKSQQPDHQPIHSSRTS